MDYVVVALMMNDENMEWIQIPPENLIKDNKIHSMNLNNKSFCLVFTTEWHAFASKCPHASAPLVNGWCEQNKVVCRYHRRKYDLETGRGDEGQGDFLKVFPLKEIDDKVFIGFAKSFWKSLFK